MAHGEPLPDEDRVTRGCSGGYENGEVTPSAFAMRRREQTKLRISVDWVECVYAAVSEQNLEGSANRMRAAPVRPPYAHLDVSEIRKVKRGSFALDATEFGNPLNPCHCGITGFTGTAVDLELQDDLAVIANRLPVTDAPK